MPGGDGTGPLGRGPGSGRGFGNGRGRLGGNRPGSGPGGDCLCPGCGNRVPHQRQTPCFSMRCPKCGVKMMKG